MRSEISPKMRKASGKKKLTVFLLILYSVQLVQ